MGVIEDVRKVVQDLVAPDLKAISARLDALEKISTARHAELLARIDVVVNTVASNHASILNALEIDKRLERLENQNSVRQADLSRSA